MLCATEAEVQASDAICGPQASKLASQQASKPASQQASKPASQQASKLASQQVSKSASQQVSKLGNGVARAVSGVPPPPASPASRTASAPKLPPAWAAAGAACAGGSGANGRTPTARCRRRRRAVNRRQQNLAPGATAGLAPCRPRRHCTSVSTSGVACVRESAGKLGTSGSSAEYPSLEAPFDTLNHHYVRA